MTVLSEMCVSSRSNGSQNGEEIVDVAALRDTALHALCNLDPTWNCGKLERAGWTNGATSFVSDNFVPNSGNNLTHKLVSSLSRNVKASTMVSCSSAPESLCESAKASDLVLRGIGSGLGVEVPA